MMHVDLPTFDIPSACLLDKPVYKKMFLENAALDATDKKALSEDIERIRWLYTLKPETINVEPFVSREHEYTEIAILTVELNNSNRAVRIASFMHKAIPYPLLLIFLHHGKAAFCTAEKRINQSDTSKLVVGERQMTDWISLSEPKEPQAAFLDAMRIGKLPSANFLGLYEGLTARIIELAASKRTGSFGAVSTPVAKAQAEILQQIETYEREVSDLRTKLKREKQMSRKITLNTEIRQRKNAVQSLEDDLRQTAGQESI